jgi:type VI secretion system secreted protein VgrG
MEITTPLGDDVLLFHGMHAREEMSRLSEYQVDLLSPRDNVEVDKILGRMVTVRLELPDGSDRFFNGYVTRFAQSGQFGSYTRYRALVRPWLWFLTRTADCRIFQELTVPDIVKAVFGDHSTADFAFELTGDYRTWTYCVQYRETDFNFVSRLLEEEGIYYYFRHTKGHDTLVLTDSTGKHTSAPGCAELPFIAPERLARADIDHVSSWQFTREIQPGVYVHDDYDFERPSVEIKTQKPGPYAFAPSNYEVYDYPGHYTIKKDGEQYAAVRMDELSSQFETAQAVTNARALRVGHSLALDRCPRADQNREYLVLGASYDLEYGDYEAMPQPRGASYRCSFVAMSTQQQFRPRRSTPKPFVQGPQTAVVVGPEGEQIYTDEYGRVKVQFHWDRYGKKDATSSCWVRVSHPWAGKGWGAVATPRIGQEVIVDFLEGDPDQPIVTGRVYNKEHLPPFGFPAGAVISGVKSDTHKGAGYNEMSFDDTAGTEKITIHGQYDMNTTVEHDQTSTIHNNRTDRVDVDDSESVGNNQTWDVGANRTATIGANESMTVTGNRTKSVTGNETVTVAGNRTETVSKSETLTVTMQRTHSVGINETISVGAAQEVTVGGMQALTVGAAQNIKVGANQSTDVGAAQSVKVGAAQNVDVGGAANLKVGGDRGIKVSGGRSSDIGKDDGIKVGQNFVVNAGDSISLKTGSASITMKKDGTVEISGKDITVKGSGKITVKASGDVVIKGSKVHQN